jgi:putative endonuclease
MKAYYAYMMTNRSRVVLYTGVTKNLESRLWFHGNTSARSFTKRYKVDRLIYYERFDKPRDAISREKEIKGCRREKKNDLVRTLNPNWEDLGQKLFGDSRRALSLRSG